MLKPMAMKECASGSGPALRKSAELMLPMPAAVRGMRHHSAVVSKIDAKILCNSMHKKRNFDHHLPISRASIGTPWFKGAVHD